MSLNSSDMESILSNLVQELKHFPGIGEKTATRLAYFILREPDTFANALSEAILDAKKKIHTCTECFTFSESTLCKICSNTERSTEIICVVESPSDLVAFERSRQFKGKYHVLHGVLSPLDGMDETRLKIKQLQEKLKAGGITEVILATNPTVEGDTTALYIARLIKYNGVRVSRIAHGIPVGAEIEYLDSATLGKALQNRVAL